MVIKTIIIQYNAKTADDGGPIDLYYYLLNELDNRKIRCRITAPGPNTSLAKLIKDALKNRPLRGGAKGRDRD